jgi:DNA-binding NarL/FixJ family response regulator
VSSQLATGKFARGHKRLAYFAKQVHRIIRKSYIAPKEFQRYNMSAQQLRILNALQDGGSNKKIAVNLGLTEAAVKYHLTNLFKIFNASSRGELIEIIDKISNSEKSYTFKS